MINAQTRLIYDYFFGWIMHCVRRYFYSLQSMRDNLQGVINFGNPYMVVIYYVKMFTS